MSMPGTDCETPAQPAEVPSPQGPWAFLGAAARGGFRAWGLQLLAGWLCFHALTSALWAGHLRSLTGNSSLPSYWGELITARDLWELYANSGFKEHPTGILAPLAALAAMAWFLWAGWKLQARAAGLRGRFKPWLYGFADAAVLAGPALWLIGAFLLWCLEGLAGTGIQGLGWLDWVGGAVLRMTLVSTFFVQVWLCRLDRAQAPAWNLGGAAALRQHLKRSFLRLWLHPVQWTALILGGVLVRAGLGFLALLIGWRMGGGTPLRVWSFLGLQALAVVADAWLIGWYLRATALFWRNDVAVQDVIMELEAQTRR